MSPTQDQKPLSFSLPHDSISPPQDHKTQARTTKWGFTMENAGNNYPGACPNQTMTLICNCEFQFFKEKAEETPETPEIPDLLKSHCTTSVIPLRLFRVETEAYFNYILSRLPIDSAYFESLDMKSLVRRARWMASTKVPLRVHLTAVTVMPFEEINRMLKARKEDGGNAKCLEVKDKDECCAICLEEFVGTMAVQVECKHIFHKHCLDRWHYSGITCPLCRAAIWRREIF